MSFLESENSFADGSNIFLLRGFYYLCSSCGLNSGAGELGAPVCCPSLFIYGRISALSSHSCEDSQDLH